MHFGLLNSVTLLLNLLNHWKFTGSIVFSESLKLQNSIVYIYILICRLLHKEVVFIL